MAIQKLENPIDDTRDIETIPREVIGKIYYPDGTREDMRGRPIDDAASKMENPDGGESGGETRKTESWSYAIASGGLPKSQEELYALRGKIGREFADTVKSLILNPLLSFSAIMNEWPNKLARHCLEREDFSELLNLMLAGVRAELEIQAKESPWNTPFYANSTVLDDIFAGKIK